MTKIENRDIAFIFSGKRPFNTPSEINLLDIVIVTMNFHLHLGRQILDSKFLCHIGTISVTPERYTSSHCENEMTRVARLNGPPRNVFRRGQKPIHLKWTKQHP